MNPFPHVLSLAVAAHKLYFLLSIHVKVTRPFGWSKNGLDETS